MGTWIEPGVEFFRLVTGYRRSSWRWECQGTYREPDEMGPFHLWQEGRPDNSFMDNWLRTIRSLGTQGKTFDRVRMVTEPPTECLEWLHSFTDLNVAAGEDIRWIAECDARALGEMPEHDFYLLDNERVAIMHFGDNGVSGAEVLDDPATVAEHRRWRDLVWPAAIAHHDMPALRPGKTECGQDPGRG